MKEKKRFPGRWCYGMTFLVVLFGILISASLLKDSGITNYPAMIAAAYGEDQHPLAVPGSRVINLTRSGAYGIYHEYSLGISDYYQYKKAPPAIDCSLTSKSTGAVTIAVPDFVATNRYWLKDQAGTGVLIMSITVNEPDTYTFACHYQDGRAAPEIGVALGPNYFWEFLKTAWTISRPLLEALAVSCGSLVIGLIMILVVFIKRQAV